MITLESAAARGEIQESFKGYFGVGWKKAAATKLFHQGVKYRHP